MAIKKFCVIGPKCGRMSSEYDRKWFESQEEAEDHARSLLRDREPGSSPAFVVEVRSVVEVKPHPISVRSARKDDFELLS